MSFLRNTNYGRQGNIIEATTVHETVLIYEMVMDENALTIKIDRMNPGQFATFRIISKQSEISKDEVEISYKEKIHIDVENVKKPLSISLSFCLLPNSFFIVKINTKKLNEVEYVKRGRTFSDPSPECLNTAIYMTESFQRYNISE